ncbi:hypothetical protein, partial [Cupriavidus sp. HPC(L)]|uniref:hypothetical protein n=1 Tax=Cupriavidus sp. HPC(L) TaxID=1217418 RepID=UPI001C128955
MPLAAAGSGWFEVGRAGADEARLRAACMRRFLLAMVRDVGRLAAVTRAGSLDRTSQGDIEKPTRALRSRSMAGGTGAALRPPRVAPVSAYRFSLANAAA